MTEGGDRLRAAWARIIGDDLVRPGVRVLDRADLDAVIVLEIGSACRVLCPPFASQSLSDLDLDDSRSIERLSARLSDHQPRAIGTAEIWASVAVPTARRGIEVRTAEVTDLETLRSRCPIDEWEESGLDGMRSVWIALDATGMIVAAAGYELWADTVAQLGVLTDPGARGRGFAAAVVTDAMSAALRHADVVQWRSRVGNTASRRLAERLGFDLVGRQSAIAIGPPGPGDLPDA